MQKAAHESTSLQGVDSLSLALTATTASGGMKGAAVACGWPDIHWLGIKGEAGGSQCDTLGQEL